MRIELMTSSLPKKCSAAELWRRASAGGEYRIRTCEGIADRFTVCSHWPLGQLPRPSETIPDARDSWGTPPGVTDFYQGWDLARSRFVAEIEGLSHAQLNWRLYPGALTIAEAAVHVAGVEAKFGGAIESLELDPTMDRVRAAATDGVVNDLPFPFSAEEMTPEFVAQALETSRAIWEPIALDPNPARRAVSLLSALGPVITGEGAMARMSFHAAYHQGQAYQIKNAPGFPM